MKYNPDIHHRKSIRLKEYDYSENGVYFVTICVQNRECRFGKIKESKMILNEAGEMVKKWWDKLEEKFPNIRLDAFIVMPNHVHGIFIIENCRGAPCGYPIHSQELNTGQPQGIAPTNSLGDIIGAFKSITTNEYICGVKSGKFPPFEKRIWQRNYHEHIIRNEKSLAEIRDYIIHNSQKWKDDCFYVESL